jgi:thymidylate synthase (FAD)
VNAEYISHMGDDLTVVNSARVSFDKEGQWEDDGGLSDKDSKLISYLARHGHWTPFSHPQITIREEVPIFVARQRFKHMIGFTYNEVSRRYVDDQPKFYYPLWRKRPEASIKQGSGFPHTDQLGIGRDYRSFINDAVQLYNRMIAEGVAPEQARMVLPQSMFTSYYVTGSLAAWARMYKQRMHETAQKEIQTLAANVAEIIEPLYPVSWAALTEE